MHLTGIKIGIGQTDLPVAGRGRAHENRPIPVTGRSIGASLIDFLNSMNRFWIGRAWIAIRMWIDFFFAHPYRVVSHPTSKSDFGSFMKPHGARRSCPLRRSWITSYAMDSTHSKNVWCLKNVKIFFFKLQQAHLSIKTVIRGKQLVWLSAK